MTYEELSARLSEADEVISALLMGEADAVVGPEGVQILRLQAVDQALQEARRSLEQIVEQRTAELQRLATAIAQAAESIIITSADGKIEYVNPAFERISGYSRTEAIGQNPRMLKSGRHDETYYREMWALLSAGSVWHGRITNRRKDGAVYEEEATISPIRGDDGVITGYVAVKRDVTRESQLEAQFHQAQKLESIGRLAGGVAHDFNNLLTVINGYSDLVMSRMAAGDPLYKSVAEILKAGERASALTGQLLAFSRGQIVDPRPLVLDDLIREAEKMLRRLIGEDIEITTDLHATGVRILADPGHMNQVLMNLVVNARDAMPAGGRLTIETRTETVPEGAMDSSGSIPGKYVVLTVRDSGTGMDEEVMRRIFEPFFTTKPQGAGTGLGLSTVYGIVKQNGGWTAVESKLGQGSTFRIYVPMMRGEPQSAAQTTASQLRGDETVLLVEDHVEVRKFAADALGSYGYTVLLAGDAEEAQALSESFTGEIHLLLTDLILPGHTGRYVAERLTEARPTLRVLYTSGYTEDPILRSRNSGAGPNFLPKPYSPTALARKVREVLGRRPVEPSILLIDREGPAGIIYQALTMAGYRVANRRSLRDADPAPDELILAAVVDIDASGPDPTRALHSFLERHPDLKIVAIMEEADHCLDSNCAVKSILFKPIRPSKILDAIANL